MEEFLKTRCEKLRELQTATVLIKGKHSLRNEFVEMRGEVSQLSAGLGKLRRTLEEMKSQNLRCKELSNLLSSLERRILHMSEHVPTRLILDCQSVEPGADWPSDQPVSDEDPNQTHQTQHNQHNQHNQHTQHTQHRDCKKTLFDEPEANENKLHADWMIQPISTEEFSRIPKYIIGRQRLEALNGFLGTLNQVLSSKYEILSLGKQQARKQGELSLYLHFVKQDLDMADEKDPGTRVYFFTGEDYERHTSTKLNKIKLNLLTVLRHCKRLREHRCKNDIRYVVVT